MKTPFTVLTGLIRSRTGRNHAIWNLLLNTLIKSGSFIGGVVVPIESFVAFGARIEPPVGRGGVTITNLPTISDISIAVSHFLVPWGTLYAFDRILIILIESSVVVSESTVSG